MCISIMININQTNKRLYIDLLKVASKHNLSEITLFNTRVTLIEWDESTASYKLKYTRKLVSDSKSKKDVKQETFEKHFNYVFGAIGPLHVPKTPNFKGLNEFKGRIIHTAAWDSSYDFTGKKVIVIGTGASAVQAVPALQKQGLKLNYSYDYLCLLITCKYKALKLTVMQRSAPWVPPHDQYKFSSIMKWIFRNVPFAMRIMRSLIILYVRCHFCFQVPN
jgi:hypothetical protein